MTEEVAREALLSFVRSKCCYGSTAAGDLIIQELKQQTLCRVRGPGPGGRLGRALGFGAGGGLREVEREKGVWGGVSACE